MPKMNCSKFLSQNHFSLENGKFEFNLENDWLENLPANAVLHSNWQQLPLEELIDLQYIIDQGLLIDGFISKHLVSNNPQFNNSQQPNEVSFLQSLDKLINIHLQLADQAAATSNFQKETIICLQVADSLYDFPANYTDQITAIARNNYASFLLRAVDAQVKLYQINPSLNIAIQIADIFAELSELTWPNLEDFLQKTNNNQLFWLRKALAMQVDIAAAAEKDLDLNEAASAYILIFEIHQRIVQITG
jgi:hypothetical protein